MRIAENDKIAFPGYLYLPPLLANMLSFMEGANKWGNSSRLTQSFHFFMFEPIFSPVKNRLKHEEMK